MAADRRGLSTHCGSSAASGRILSLRFLLDTNVLSDLVRHPQGRTAARIAAVGEDRVCTSIIVAAEPRDGAAHAVALGLTLVTDNEGEFSRIEGLTVENWPR